MTTALLTDQPLLDVVGADLMVPLATGGFRRYVNLDSAASTPALSAVDEAIARLSPWYSSVHRGAGWASQVSTDLYEWARERVHEFVGATDDHVVVFTRNTTEALNLAARTLPIDGAVLTTLVEHHANLLPWRRDHEVVQLAPPDSPEALLDRVEDALRGGVPVGALTVTGASNVTGEVLPVAALARLARDHGALFVLDAAQLAPHRPIDMGAWGVDALALSGHKMHAPYGAGALVVRRDLVAAAEPLLAGGGAVDLVSDTEVDWTDGPERHEAGTPNVVGAVALGVACAELGRLGMDTVAAHERGLQRMLADGLDSIRGVGRLELWDTHDRLGLATFTVDGRSHGEVAAILSAEHAVGVRDGCFCAHPYMLRLLRVPPEDECRFRDEIRAGIRANIPGAVRASVSVGTTEQDVEAFLTALAWVADRGPALSYRGDERGHWHAVGDQRRHPDPATLLGLGA